MSNFLAKYGLKFERANVFVLLLLLAFPVLPMHINNYVIALVTILSLVNIILFPKASTEINWFKSTLLASSFIVLGISLLYSTDKGAGFFEMEKRAVLILFPAIFLVKRTRISLKTRDLFEIIFALIILLFFTYLNAKILIDLRAAIHKGILQGSYLQILKSENFYYIYRTYFEKISNIHPTYASIYALFSAGILILKLLDGKDSMGLGMKIAFVIAVGLLFGYSLFLAAKGPLLAFIISLLFILFLKLKKIHFITVSVGFVLFFATLIFTVPNLKNRVVELVGQEDNKELNSVSIRKVVLNCSVQQIKENWLMGVGVGDVQENLNNCYEQYQGESELNRLNTHNEFLNMCLAAGILGLGSLVITLLIPFIDSLKLKDYHFLFFIVFIMICFLFENILSRQKGVLFFAFFYLSYLYYQIDFFKCQQDIQST